MIPAPCTRCQRPVEPPLRRGRPRAYVDLCRPCRVWTSTARHHQSEKCRATRERYRQAGKLRAALARYRQSEKGRAKEACYRQSEKYRAKKARYHRSEKFRAALARYYHSEKGRRYYQSEEYRAARARYRDTDEYRAQAARREALRRARELTAIVLESVDRRMIFVLDGGLCHLCDVPVDPDAFHVDHVIPLAVEAIEAEFNCAVAHPSCNVRKGARRVGLSSIARARWQERRPEHLALLDQHLARLAA
jgi:5-methylcytosine-specific restriction endonuclease McrA